MEHWWKDTDRRKHSMEQGGMILTGETEYGAMMERY